MVDERETGGAVENFRYRRLHSRPLAGGEDDDVNVRQWAHGRTVLTKSGGRPASWNSVSAGWAAAIGGRRRVERGSEVFVIADGFEVRILTRQSAVVRVQAYGAAQVIDRFVGPPAHPERDGHDVVRVVALGILAERALEMIQGAV